METIEDWQIALRAFTDIQLHCTETSDELISFACADRRLSLLPNLLEPVLAELDEDQGRKFYEVTEAEAKELTQRIRRLPALCRKLSDCGMPETVVHGEETSKRTLRQMRDGSWSFSLPVPFATYLRQNRSQLEWWTIDLRISRPIGERRKN